MIVFDTETTRLNAPDVAAISKQPKIIEFAAIKLDDTTLDEIGRIDFLVNPQEKLEPIITKITGITDSDLKDQPPFSQRVNEISDFFLGEKHLVAHNLGFDSSVMRYELTRLNRLFKFPWPPNWHCTVELTMDIRGKRMKLSDLYQHYTGEEFKEAHRAIKDTEALCEVIRYMRKEGRI